MESPLSGKKSRKANATCVRFDAADVCKIAQYLGHSPTVVAERVNSRVAPDHLRDEADILDFTKIRRAFGLGS